MKIVVKGAYGESNFGDDLLMVTLENFFHGNFPAAELFFLSGSGIDTSYCDKLLDRSIYIGNNRQIQQIKNIDILAFGGGTQFFSFGSTSLLSKFKKLLLLLRDYTAFIGVVKAKLNKTSIVARQEIAIGIGIGPFSDPAKETSAKQTLSKLNCVSVRDAVSADFCKKWQIHNFIEGADICFSKYVDLPQDFVQTQKHTSHKKIGVIVRDWVQDEKGAAYYNPLIDYAKKAAGQGVDFTFIIFAPDRDKKWLRKTTENNLNTLIWHPEKDTIKSFIYKLNSFDGFITARYHGAVFAALLNKPTICVEIEPKLKILTEQIPEFPLWKNDFDPNKLNMLMSVFQREFNCSASVKNLTVRANDMLAKIAETINDPKK